MTKLTLRLMTVVSSSIVTWGGVLLTEAGAIATTTAKIEAAKIEAVKIGTEKIDSKIEAVKIGTEKIDSKIKAGQIEANRTDPIEIDLSHNLDTPDAVELTEVVEPDSDADITNTNIEATEDTVDEDTVDIDADSANTTIEAETNAEADPVEAHDPVETHDPVEAHDPVETVESDDADEERMADDSAEDTGEDVAEDADDSVDEELTAEELERRRLLIEGDRLFLNGQVLDAEELYRQAKDPFHEEGTFDRPAAFRDPEQLSPAGRVYWREYQSGLELGLETRIQVPLELLLETQPEFIPGHVAYAQLLTDEDNVDEALHVLERATSLYPTDADLATTRVNTLVADEQWLQAAIAARQFAILNPDDPNTATFETWANEYQNRFRSKMRGRLLRNTVGNAITGALGFAITGSWFGPLSAVETSVLMIRGESAVGERVANNASEELDLIEDETVLAYVDEIGQELAILGGRSEFDYQFYVVADDELNAFALPGGKIFINAGAITRTDTGAELAGLIAHELAHAILSHGFQQVTRGNLTANVLQFVPYGGLVTNLTVLRYSRDMERQADRLGTYLLATSPYAADGLRNLMQTLWDESEDRSRFDWLSTHPDIPERIRNMERLIEQNGYNRYAFEDMERHLRIQERVQDLLIEMEQIEMEQIDSDNDSDSDSDADNPDHPEVEGASQAIRYN